MHLHRESALSQRGLVSFDTRRFVARTLLAGLIAVSTFASAFSTHALQSVTLAWDANSETNLVGYKLYFGTSSRQYTNVSNLGNVLSTSVTLLEGSTYYFAVTAVNALGIESDYSAEVSQNIPGNRSPLTISIVGSG